MPWKNIEDVPAQVKKHKGSALSLEQANKWAEIFDAIKGNGNIKEPAAAAWTTWEEVYELKEGSWVKRKREKSESMLLIEELATVESVSDGEDGLPSKAKIVLITAGPCKTKNREYSRAALINAVSEGVFENLQMYDSHPAGSEQMPGATQAPRRVAELMSYVIPGSVKFDETVLNPVTRTPMGGVVAETELIDEDFRKSFKRKSKIIGPSLNSLVEAAYQAGKEIVTKIRKGISADWVPKPNAGGMVLEVVEAEEPFSEPSGKEVTEQMEWKDITTEELRKNRPDLVTSLTSESEAKVAAAETKATAAETKATEATAQKDAAVAEASATKKALDDKTKEFAEAQEKIASAGLIAKAIEMVESKGAGLNILGKAQVMKTILGKSFKTEQEVAEAVESEVAKYPQPGVKGSGTPAAGGGTEPALPAGSQAFAESIGMSDADIKRLAGVR
jgi:hypothetical protein